MQTETLLTLVSGLLIATNVYWAIQVHRLMNKLMSRNFAEYNQVVQGHPIPTPTVPQDQEEQREQETILQELNALLPS